jgi:pimeloyl-ACP methyl ester carboxylesterase
MVMTSPPPTVDQFPWNWQNQTFTVVYETWGQGMPVLLLPAFSTVSSRSEMGGIAQLLASQFQVYALDWLGFGDSERPFLDYQPAIFQQLLEDFVKATFKTPVAIVAAGHASGYALQLAKINPNLVLKLVLVAPTWLGPLCAMGLPEEMRGVFREMVRSPILGEFLYFLNTTPSFLHFMYSRHVYVDDNKLTTEFIEQKQKITQHPNARYAPAAFVTGKLDPVTNRSQFLDYFSSLTIPVLVIIAENAPPKSKAEMEALASLQKLQTVRLRGTLGLHEEDPTAVTEAVLPFLSYQV